MSNETAMSPVRGGGETISVSAGTPNARSSAVAPFDARMVMIGPVSADVYIAIGQEADLEAGLSDVLFSSDWQFQYFVCRAGDYVAVERVSADATVRIHWMRRP